MDLRIKKKDEPLRRAKYKVGEVVTGIYGLMGNDDDDAEFIKSQYCSSTCINLCNYGVNL